jgi:hypothetical protein
MIHLTLSQSMASISTLAAAWLMIRAGSAKGALTLRKEPRCPSCGRRRTRRGCLCTNTQ